MDNKNLMEEKISKSEAKEFEEAVSNQSATLELDAPPYVQPLKKRDEIRRN